MPKIAVVLSGCGVYDGSEIHETAAAMAALTRGGAEVLLINVYYGYSVVLQRKNRVKDINL